MRSYLFNCILPCLIVLAIMVGGWFAFLGFARKHFVTREYHRVSARKSLSAKIADLQEFNLLRSTPRDAAYVIDYTANPFGPDTCHYMVAVKVDPRDIPKWETGCKTASPFAIQALATLDLSGDQWLHHSPPRYYHINGLDNKLQIIYPDEGIVWLDIWQ